MTVSLTFDDGLRAHKNIVAPLLKNYGWIGAFNVCTDFLDPHPETLTDRMLDVMRINGHADARMNWDDVCQLLEDGHEVYPHGCTHADLGELWKAGKYDEVCHEIHDSIEAYRQHVGRTPLYFCCPHLSWTEGVLELIHTERVEMFNNCRIDLGTNDAVRVVDLLFDKYYWGWRHVDLMFHGIVAREGGYRPFADEADFEAALLAIKHLEDIGKIKVVPYAQAHLWMPSFPALRESFAYCRRGIGHVRSKLISMSWMGESFRWK